MEEVKDGYQKHAGIKEFTKGMGANGFWEEPRMIISSGPVKWGAQINIL
jgi:hypothetical protein